MPEKNKELIRLARLGDMEAIQEWIAVGNAPVYLEELPFVLSDVVLTGFISIVRLLLRSYDWRQWPDELDSALANAVGISRPDMVQLLIDAGADAECVEWSEVLHCYSAPLIVSMIRARTDYDEIFRDPFPVSKPAMAAFKIVSQDRNPKLAAGFAKGVIEAWEGAWQWDERPRVKRLFGVLCWAGVDTRCEVVVYSDNEEKTFVDSLLGLAIRRGTAKQLKTLAPNRGDLKIIRHALHAPCELDDEKLRLLLDAGLELNDRADGTSSYVRAAIDHQKFKSAAALARKGAKLQVMTKEEFRKFRGDSLYEYYKGNRLPEEDVLALDELLPPDQLAAYRRSVYHPSI